MWSVSLRELNGEPGTRKPGWSPRFPGDLWRAVFCVCSAIVVLAGNLRHNREHVTTKLRFSREWCRGRRTHRARRGCNPYVLRVKTGKGVFRYSWDAVFDGVRGLGLGLEELSGRWDDVFSGR